MRITDAPKLSDLTTIQLGGRAIALVQPETTHDVEQLHDVLHALGGTPFMLGRGSNLLAYDGHLPYTLVRPLPYTEPTAQQDGEKILVNVDASFPMPRLLAWSAKHGLAGLMPLTGIPGEVGGALRMNAGSYGTSFCDHVVSVRLFSPTRGFYSVDREKISPGYRHTVFPGDEDNPLLLGATLSLTRGDSALLRMESRNCMKKKLSTQPVHACSAGCAFANPPDIPAGKLLDELGFRGKSHGGMAFSFVHANYLVNTGYGTTAQALALLEEARDAAREKRGIDLKLEVRLLPC